MLPYRQVLSFVDLTIVTSTLRWEKFAPGPVKKVTITHNHPDALPKPKGRPRKRPAESTIVKPKGDGEMVFGHRSKKRGPVVPPPEDGNADDVLGDAEPSPPVDVEPNPSASSGVARPSWPTRATFAGRKKPTDKEAANLFDSRREKFYQLAPSTLWRDGKEREYWKLCVQFDSCDKGITEFLKKEGVCPDPTPLPPGHGRAAGRGKGKGKGRGRGSAKSVKPNAKEPGRKRSRGKASLKN